MWSVSDLVYDWSQHYKTTVFVMDIIMKFKLALSNVLE